MPINRERLSGWRRSHRTGCLHLEEQKLSWFRGGYSMAASSLSILFFVHFMAATILVMQHLPLVTSQELEDEKEFDYIKGSEKGPEKWGQIKPEWGNCSAGEMQSPIDLSRERVQALPLLGRLKRSYKSAKAIVKNRGHDVMLRWEDEAGSIFINGTEFLLKQLHWHSPSEHSFNGRRYALEVHMVHESRDKKIAVVGITYKIGRPDSFLNELMPEIRGVSEQKDAEVGAGMVDPKRLKVGSRKYYRYVGSLTTPPCTEGVIWTIVKKVRTASRVQIKTLRDAVHDGHDTNARPIQEINHRQVHLYTPKVFAGHQRF